MKSAALEKLQFGARADATRLIHFDEAGFAAPFLDINASSEKALNAITSADSEHAIVHTAVRERAIADWTDGHLLEVRRALSH
jgi:hypothetical protein